jgi:hypothetical protein
MQTLPAFQSKLLGVPMAISRLTLLSATIVTLTAVGCGGGGGGGGDTSYSGAANVSIRATPSKIDTGSRTQVTIDISDVIESGIALKIRYPIGLKYVPSTAFLEVGEKEVDLTPTINVDVSKDDEAYLVFYMPQSQFKRSGQDYEGEQATMVLQLEGREEVQNGQIEVDPDVDDPAEDNASEFNVDTPEFEAEDSTPIEVVGE